MAVGTLVVFFALGGSAAGATSAGESKVTAPPVARPPVSVPQGTTPPVTVPPVSVPTVTVPPVTVPVVIAPPVTAPPSATPPTAPATSGVTEPTAPTQPAATSPIDPALETPPIGSGSAVVGERGKTSSIPPPAALPARLARGALDTARQLRVPLALSLAILLFLVIEPFSGKRDPRLVNREINDDGQLGFS